MPETSFTVTSPAFNGPLDVLLDVIEARKLPISAVSLSAVADAYVAYVEQLPELPLSETAQFVLIASTLLLIKSRSLLPTLDLTEDEELTVEELERRLKRLRIYREAAKKLRSVWGVRPLTLALRAPARPTIFAPSEAAPSTLARAAQRLIATFPPSLKSPQVKVAPVLALEDVIIRLRDRLTWAARTSFRDVIKNAGSKHEVIVYFLAMLELVKTGSASVTQDRIFEDIVIEIEQVGIPRYGG